MMRQYEVFELTFDGENINHDWADADINAIFKDSSGEKKVKGFYAGEGKYKVRYLPEAVGLVSWKVSGAVNAEGCENCEPADETHHGIVRAEKTFETLANSPFNKVRYMRMRIQRMQV